MTDKKYHVLAGLLIAAAVGLPCYLESLNLFAGGVKEYCDMRAEGNKWDWLDFGCTCIGAVVVAVLIVGLNFGKG